MSHSYLNTRDKVMEVVFVIATAMSIVAVGLICLFIFSSSIPTMQEIGLGNFLFGQVWRPTAAEPQFGIFPMIIASIYVTVGAIIIGVPVGILTALFMAFYVPKKFKTVLQAGINLLAGIPSIVYGLWALEVVVPLLRDLFEGYGLSMLAAMILLGIMILPTVISLSQASLLAVPQEYYDGAVALGASHERAVYRVMLPAASSGVLSSVIMGIGRAIGETMAVKMVIGNQPIMPTSIFNGARTMTTNIILEMNYAAAGVHRNSLIATGAVLFIFILLINIAFNVVKNRSAHK